MSCSRLAMLSLMHSRTMRRKAEENLRPMFNGEVNSVTKEEEKLSYLMPVLYNIFADNVCHLIS